MKPNYLNGNKDCSDRGKPKLLQKKTTYQKSKDQENNIAKDVKGYRRSGSGNQEGYPGDIVQKNFLIEAKQTGCISYRLKKGTINKIKKEALSCNKEWAMIIEIDDIQVAVIDYNIFLELFNE